MTVAYGSIINFAFGIYRRTLLYRPTAMPL